MAAEINPITTMPAITTIAQAASRTPIACSTIRKSSPAQKARKFRQKVRPKNKDAKIITAIAPNVA